MMQETHGDIQVTKNSNAEFEGIQVKAYFDLETGAFTEPSLTI
jgi:hypothetical protein